MAHFTPTDQATFQRLISTDPQIQAVIRGVWGNTPVNQRPSKTPDNLGAANDRASKQIAAILASRGIKLPDKTFINPRSESLEGARGWAGLPTAAKIAIIGGLAATGIGAAGALGAFGGAAGAGAGAASGAAGAGAGAGAGAAGAALPTIATTAGLPSLAGVGTAVGASGLALPAGLGGAAAAGSGLAGGAGSLVSKLATSGTPNIPTTSGFGGLPAGFGGSAGIPEIPTTTGFGGLPSTFGGDAVTSVNASDPSFLSRLKDGAGSLMRKVLTPGGLQTAGSMLGAISQTQASNRGTKLDAQLEADKNRLAGAANQRNEESYLWKMLQAADYMKNGGTKFTPTKTASGFELPNYNFGPAPISDANKEMAATLEGQLMNRLKNPLQLSDYNKQMDPSGTERALDIASPILSGVGSLINPNSQQAITTPQAPVRAPKPGQMVGNS